MVLVDTVLGVGGLLGSALGVKYEKISLGVGAGIAVGASALLFLTYKPVYWDATSKFDKMRTGDFRKVGKNLPCPYPDAWYSVCYTPELKRGQLREATVCGKKLIVFRNSEGKACVMDAHCTHLGAHLSHGGGRIEDDCVRCPFHGWRFNGEGKLVSTPGGNIPAGTDLKTYQVSEKNGIVSVWMASTQHLEGCGLNQKATDGDTTDEEKEMKVKPALLHSKPYEIPEVPELNGSKPSFVYHGYFENIVNAMIFELPENGPDVAHLDALHSSFFLPELDGPMSHKWDAKWYVGEGKQKHLAFIDLTESMLVNVPFLGPVKIRPLDISVRATQYGPSQVTLELFTGLGKAVVVQSVTPEGPLRMRVRHAIYASPWMPRFVAMSMLYATKQQFEKDVPIWCNKEFLSAPKFNTEDKAIAVYRRWLKQFFNENSITFEQAQKQNLAARMGFNEDAKLDW